MRASFKHLIAAAAMVVAFPLHAQEWKPEQPVTVIVPWAAGGSTDTVTRVVAGELSKAIGQSFVILNQPGASGSVGTRAAWEAAHDGMTLAAGAVADLGAYPVLDMLDAQLSDWRIYIHVANPGLISVPVNSEWQDFGQLLEALKTTNEPLTVSSGGLSSSAAISMQTLEKAEPGIKYRQIVYEGGAPSVIATVAGETAFTAATATEQVDMIRAGRLRPLAVVADQPLELDGFGTVPAVTDWLPNVKSAPNYFGIYIPADAPKEVLDTMDKIWAETIKDSEVLKKHAAERGALFNPLFGDEAVAAATPYMAINAWQQFESGAATNDPSQFGIPKPE